MNNIAYQCIIKDVVVDKLLATNISKLPSARLETRDECLILGPGTDSVVLCFFPHRMWYPYSLTGIKFYMLHNVFKLVSLFLDKKTNKYFTLSQLWPSGIVVACVCPCVYVSVCQTQACWHDNSSPVQARSTRFGQKIPSRSNFSVCETTSAHQLLPLLFT